MQNEMDRNMVGDGDLGLEGIFSIWGNGRVMSVQQLLMNVRDLIQLIVEYCDDATLNKLCRVCQFFYKFLLKEETHRSKDYQIRILRYRLNAVNGKMDHLIGRITNGEQTPNAALRNAMEQPEN